MGPRRSAWVLVIALAWCGLDGHAADDVGLAEEQAFKAAAARVAPAVVRIEPAGVSTAAVEGSAEATPASGPSTGLVVDPAGWIITTAFAVPEGMSQAIVLIASPGGETPSRLAARVVGRDASRGIVLLKVERDSPLAAVTAAVPRDTLAVGQWTIAVGRGWDATTPNLAVGALSATSRSWGRAVQTDAAVSPANYGGPLVDIRGDVIGLLAPLPADTAGMPLGTELYDSGIGFAVPLEDILRVLPRLKAGESLVPGLLGISYRSRDVFTGTPTVAASRRGSPAAEAGIRPGDTIVAADGRPIRRIAELRHALTPKYAGDEIDLTVERPVADGTPRRIEIRARLVANLPPSRRAIVGIVPRRVATAEEREGGARQTPVVVDWVWPGSPAAKAGIAPGSVVQSVTPPGDDADAVAVTSEAVLAGVLGGIEIDDVITLVVKDAGGQSKSHTLTTVALPTDVPGETPTRPESPAPATVVKLEAPDVADPPLAVIPAGAKDDPVGVLIFLGQPHGPIAAAEAEAWLTAANRYGIAVILPGSSDPQRWSRSDLTGIARSVNALRSRRAIDRSRMAVAGSGAGGALAWMAVESRWTDIRGVAMLDSDLPRQARVDPAEPGRTRWVLFGAPREKGRVPPRIEADRTRLVDAGYDVGILPERPEGSIPCETLCGFVEALGVL